MAACVKHFAAYGAVQAGREYHTVELSEHTLREYYLPAYQAGIDCARKFQGLPGGSGESSPSRC